MKSKRGQSEIITTVLIILLVLAAIIIVWQVVNGTLNAGKTDIEKKRSCFGLDLNIVKATNATTNNILIRREGTSSATGVKVSLFVNDAFNLSSTIGDQFYSVSPILTVNNLAVGQSVQVTAVLSDGTICGLTSKVIVASA